MDDVMIMPFSYVDSDMAGGLPPLHTNYLALDLIPRADLHSEAS
jgi:hypothetical protein